jgi:hypothetical protein
MEKSKFKIQNWWILVGVKSDIDKMYPDNRVTVKLNFAPSDSIITDSL